MIIIMRFGVNNVLEPIYIDIYQFRLGYMVYLTSFVY